MNTHKPAGLDIAAKPLPGQKTKPKALPQGQAGNVIDLPKQTEKAAAK